MIDEVQEKEDVMVLVVDAEDLWTSSFKDELSRQLRLGFEELEVARVVNSVRSFFNSLKQALSKLEIEVIGLPCSRFLLSRPLAEVFKSNWSGNEANIAQTREKSREYGKTKF